jgi:hypothetical protein
MFSWCGRFGERGLGFGQALDHANDSAADFVHDGSEPIVSLPQLVDLEHASPFRDEVRE